MKINIRETNCAIQWIEISPVNNVNHLLNNLDQPRSQGSQEREPGNEVEPGPGLYTSELIMDFKEKHDI